LARAAMMFSSRTAIASTVLALSLAGAGCMIETGESTDDVTDVNHSKVERQAIGNCWLYAEASWVESMNLSATGKEFDISQSYWTYWHWFDEITGYGSSSEIETGGSFYTARGILESRGLMPEDAFVPEDATSEMSSRQHDALDRINAELKSGRLANSAARRDGKLVRKVLDEAWSLTPAVRAQLDKAFGADAKKTLKYGASTAGTSIIAPKNFPVAYTQRSSAGKVTPVKTTLDRALADWREAYYPSSSTGRRDFQIRVQRALHDRNPVVISWKVDFNAMEGYDEALKGSFNKSTLKKAPRPGRQGGHMTVLEDYEIVTQKYGVLKAGVTLDPSNPTDADKLAAALLPTSKMRFLRVKNSWGAFRDDRTFAPGFPGYHDLYMDYLDGPIAWCPDLADPKDPAKCKGTATPWGDVVLPPGY
jgi:hypothetical protein